MVKKETKVIDTIEGPYQDCCRRGSWRLGRSSRQRCSDAVPGSGWPWCTPPGTHGTGQGYQTHGLQITLYPDNLTCNISKTATLHWYLNGFFL